jgi:hypothetical protein
MADDWDRTQRVVPPTTSPGTTSKDAFKDAFASLTLIIIDYFVNVLRCPAPLFCLGMLSASACHASAVFYDAFRSLSRWIKVSRYSVELFTCNLKVWHYVSSVTMALPEHGPAVVSSLLRVSALLFFIVSRFDAFLDCLAEAQRIQAHAPILLKVAVTLYGLYLTAWMGPIFSKQHASREEDRGTDGVKSEDDPVPVVSLLANLPTERVF